MLSNYSLLIVVGQEARLKLFFYLPMKTFGKVASNTTPDNCPLFQDVFFKTINLAKSLLVKAFRLLSFRG